MNFFLIFLISSWFFIFLLEICGFFPDIYWISFCYTNVKIVTKITLGHKMQNKPQFLPLYSVKSLHFLHNSMFHMSQTQSDLTQLDLRRVRPLQCFRKWNLVFRTWSQQLFNGEKSVLLSKMMTKWGPFQQSSIEDLYGSTASAGAGWFLQEYISLFHMY